jgi:hypothetical protein
MATGRGNFKQGVDNSFRQKIVFKVVPSNISNDQIVSYCQQFGKVTQIDDTQRQASKDHS